MAEAVEQAIGPASTWRCRPAPAPGKSLAYLVPAVGARHGHRLAVVVATATIALQRQLIDRDLPRLGDVARAAARPAAGLRDPQGPPQLPVPAPAALRRRRRSPATMLFDPAATSGGRPAGAAAARVGRRPPAPATATSWCPGWTTGPGARSSVSARECIGAQRCPFGTQCFAEQARDAAGQADIVVTNHALLAIDALEDFAVLPEHDVVIIDEAHDLVNRVTSVGRPTSCPPPALEIAARRCGRLFDEKAVARLREAAEAAERVLAEIPGGPDRRAGRVAGGWRWPRLRDAAAGCAAEVRASAKETERGRRAARRPPGGAGRARRGMRATADRILAAFGPDIADPAATWCGWTGRSARRRAGRRRCGSPRCRSAGCWPSGCSAAGPVVLTSATLALGGSFEPLARQWGLRRPGTEPRARQPRR